MLHTNTYIIVYCKFSQSNITLSEYLVDQFNFRVSYMSSSWFTFTRTECDAKLKGTIRNEISESNSVMSNACLASMWQFVPLGNITLRFMAVTRMAIRWPTLYRPYITLLFWLRLLRWTKRHLASPFVYKLSTKSTQNNSRVMVTPLAVHYTLNST